MAITLIQFEVIAPLGIISEVGKFGSNTLTKVISGILQER